MRSYSAVFSSTVFSRMLNDDYSFIDAKINRYDRSKIVSGKITTYLDYSVDTSSDEFLNFVKSDCVEYIVSKENRILKRSLKNSGKSFIRLDSCFNKQKRY